MTRLRFDIVSPSRVFIEQSRRILDAALEGMKAPYAPTPRPWYAARGPLDPWPSREMAKAAKALRRRIQREQPAIIALFWRYAGVDDQPMSEQHWRALHILIACKRYVSGFERAVVAAQFYSFAAKRGEA